MKTLFKSTMLAGALLAIVSTTQAQWSAVDVFDSLTLGDINGQNGWTNYDSLTLGSTTNANVILDPAGGGPVTTNKVLGLADNTTAYRGVTIPDLTTGTLFLRFRTSSNHAGTIGMSDTLVGTSIGFPQIESYLNMQPLPSTAVFTRNGSAGAVPVIPNLPLNTWFNVWFVIDNSADTTTFYLNSGFRQNAGAGDVLISGTVSNFVFRTAYGFGNAMVNFVIKSQLAADINNPASFYIDDVYLDSSGANLSNPMPVVNATDTEGDGLPDWWEMLYWTNLTTANATSDSNADGMTDLQCFQAGISPLPVQPLLTSFTVRGYATSLIQVPKGAGFNLYWQVLPAPNVTVSMNQGVGNVLPLTTNGLGSITITNNISGTHTYTLTASNSANSAVATSSVQVVVMPAGVGFVTLNDMPYSGIPANSAAMLVNSNIAGLPAGITATWTGWAWGDGSSDLLPGIMPDHLGLWIYEGHANVTDDASIEFSQPVVLARFSTQNPNWGGPTDPDTGGTGSDVGAKGYLGGVEVWTWAATPAPGDGTGVDVTAGAGILVDKVGFTGLWRSFDNFVIETSAGAANHAAVQLATPAKQSGNVFNSWNSQSGWVYSVRTNGLITESWNQLDLDPIPSAGATTTHTNTAGDAEGYFRVLRAP